MNHTFITDLDHTFLRNDLTISQFSKDIWNKMAQDHIMSVATARAHKKTEQFVLKLSDSPIFIKGNKQKLEQVVINLIQNSCEAIESKTDSLIVCIEADMNVCTILFEDQGKGIPEESIGQLTDPFVTSRRSSGGTGLGLSVSAGIVKDHNGKLDFQSEIGKGTIARVQLPFMYLGKDSHNDR